ncbi:MAG: glycosyltransferase family 2 protein [Anaerolineales bacterium]|jgi:glycosyltransferase involved in cell wall biosynthesis|nr:glycosyltransferase family 2 protein [Anaerolineales bacterium]
MTTLSIVIPAYNEERGIAEIVQRVLAVREKLDKASVELVELLVVDDGSKDHTAQIIGEIEKTDPCVKLVRHPQNRGYGAALKTGFSTAQGELIGFLDADGTYPPEYFPELCQLAMQGNDLVIGSRMSGADSKMPVTRRIGNLFFAGLLSLLSHQNISDSASGMRVFRKDILETIYPLPDGLNLTPVMSARAVHEGIKMVEYPIPYSERIGRSKLSVVRDGSIFLRSIIWTVLSYNPVGVFGFFGLGGILITALVGVGLVVARLSGVTTIGAWGVAALFWALVSGIVGINIFALGLTSNYLVSLFNRRPIQSSFRGRKWLPPTLDRHFGWLGLVAVLLGLLVASVSLILGIRGWEVARIWLYLLGSAMFILMGVQLMIYWILMRVLEEISQRGNLIERDMLSVTIQSKN